MGRMANLFMEDKKGHLDDEEYVYSILYLALTAHRSNFPPYLISHGKLVYTFKYAYMNFPKKGNMCHHNINSGT